MKRSQLQPLDSSRNSTHSSAPIRSVYSHSVHFVSTLVYTTLFDNPLVNFQNQILKNLQTLHTQYDTAVEDLEKLHSTQQNDMQVSYHYILCLNNCNLKYNFCQEFYIPAVSGQLLAFAKLYIIVLFIPNLQSDLRREVSMLQKKFLMESQQSELATMKKNMQQLLASSF